MTSGSDLGISGAPFWLRWVVFAVAALLIVTVQLDGALGAASRGVYPLWRAVTDAYSSVGITILGYPALRWLAYAARPGVSSLWRLAAVHCPGLIGFWVTHVTGLNVIRTVVYAAAGSHHSWGGLSGYLAYLTSDALVYAGIMGLLLFVIHLELSHVAVTQAVGAPATFDIQDGSQTIRVVVDTITAVRGAGNYAEFVLADGRRPLMRATLAALEISLEPHGFTRTHRSWIVNRAAIMGMTSSGSSGDAELSLKGGVDAVLSRRFRGSSRLLPGSVARQTG